MGFLFVLWDKIVIFVLWGSFLFCGVLRDKIVIFVLWGSFLFCGVLTVGVSATEG